MPQGMSQCAFATVDGRSQLVRRDMRTPRLSCRGRWPGDLAAGVGTGGRGRSASSIRRTSGGPYLSWTTAFTPVPLVARFATIDGWVRRGFTLDVPERVRDSGHNALLPRELATASTP